MTFFLHQRWVVMLSQITPAQSSNTHTLARIPGTSLLICSSCALFSLFQPCHVTTTHPSLSDNPQERWRPFRNNAGQKNGRVKFNQLDICTGLDLTPSYLSCIVAQPPPTTSLCSLIIINDKTMKVTREIETCSKNIIIVVILFAEPLSTAARLLKREFL